MLDTRRYLMVKYITRWQRVILFLTVFEHGSLSFIYERRICTMRKKAAKMAALMLTAAKAVRVQPRAPAGKCTGRKMT